MSDGDRSAKRAHRWGNVEMPTSMNKGQPDTGFRFGREKGVLKMIRQSLTDDSVAPRRIGPTWHLMRFLFYAPLVLGYWYFLEYKTKQMEAMEIDFGEGGQFRMKQLKRLDRTQDAVVETGQGLRAVEEEVTVLKQIVNQYKKEAEEARQLAYAIQERLGTDGHAGHSPTTQAIAQPPSFTEQNQSHSSAPVTPTDSLANTPPAALTGAPARPALHELEYIPRRRRTDDLLENVYNTRGGDGGVPFTARAPRIDENAPPVEGERKPFYADGMAYYLYLKSVDVYGVLKAWAAEGGSGTNDQAQESLPERRKD